jgi:hypothetical protein
VFISAALVLVFIFSLSVSRPWSLVLVLGPCPCPCPGPGPCSCPFVIPCLAFCFCLFSSPFCFRISCHYLAFSVPFLILIGSSDIASGLLSTCFHNNNNTKKKGKYCVMETSRANYCKSHVRKSTSKPYRYRSWTSIGQNIQYTSSK